MASTLYMTSIFELNPVPDVNNYKNPRNRSSQCNSFIETYCKGVETPIIRQPRKVPTRSPRVSRKQAALPNPKIPTLCVKLKPVSPRKRNRNGSKIPQSITLLRSSSSCSTIRPHGSRDKSTDTCAAEISKALHTVTGEQIHGNDLIEPETIGEPGTRLWNAKINARRLAREVDIAEFLRLEALFCR